MSSTFHNEAVALLDLLESDFGQSGRDVRIEAIRCELERAYARTGDRPRPGDALKAMMQQRAEAFSQRDELLRALIDMGDWLAYGLNKADGAEPTAEDHAACERVAAQARAAIAKATIS